MIISVEELKKQVSTDEADDLIASKLEAIEAVIRRYTNNNFQLRDVRFVGRAEDMMVYGSPRFFSAGDTVQISGSGANDGLYTVAWAGEDHLELDKPLNPVEYNIVTKVKYPADVVQCAVDLFQWKQTMGRKVGIKSETISRHSVTYEDSSALFMGYPMAIMGGLNLYKKARC